MKITKTFGGIIAQNPDHIWDSDEIDAVLIASSTNTHVELLRGAIKSRKATFCEKPIDIDLKKAKEIEEEANHKDVPIFMAFRRRFVPEIQMIHQKIHQGSLGQVEVVQIIARDFQPPPISYVNVSGGLLSKGHPLGATGIANIYEVSTHLRGEAGERQVEGAKLGLTHVIGLGSACGIHILEKVN